MVEAEHGRCSVECAEAGEEGRAVDEAAPAPADERGAVEAVGVGREAEEDLEEEVLRRRQRRRRGARARALRRGEHAPHRTDSFGRGGGGGWLRVRGCATLAHWLYTTDSMVTD